MKLGHVSTVPRRWAGWRVKGPVGRVDLILTRPIDRVALAQRELDDVQEDLDQLRADLAAAATAAQANVDKMNRILTGATPE